MALPEFSMRQLLEAGVHFGHQTHRWNPKMAPYIFGARSNIHIMDLSQTVPLLHQALVQARDVAAKGGRVLFVGTKRAASEPVATSAKRCAQYYVNHRWLGGMLTNWQTVSGSIKRLRELEGIMENSAQSGLTKKEILNLTREQEKLDKALGGIKDMGGKPDLMFVIDTNKESIAIKEARRLKIPVIAILDTNCDPTAADFPIPGNDDAARAIQLYCDLIADAVLDGMTEAQANVGVDLGAAENPVEMALEAKEEAPAKPAKPAPVVETKPAKKVAKTPAEAPAPATKVPAVEPATVKVKAAAAEESEYLRVTREYDADVDAAVVTKIEKHLGASLSNRDSKYVACSDETELETIVKGFMKKKLEITDKDEAMTKVKAVCETMKPTRMKNRVTFYYLLAKNEDKLSVF
jgi:small subunit ribosomal protein S2